MSQSKQKDVKPEPEKSKFSEERFNFTIYDEKGSEIKQTYVYSFAKMSMKRVFAAEQLFLLNSEFYAKQNVPGTDEQFLKNMERKTLQKALEAILMKEIPQGRFEKYNPEQEPEFDIFDGISGEDYDRVMVCKDDFFSRSKVLSKTSINAFLEPILKLKEILPENMLSGIITNIMVAGIKGSAGNNSENDGIQENIMRAVSENLSIGV